MEKYAGSDGADPAPVWVNAFRNFYTEFQKFFISSYEDEHRASCKIQPEGDEKVCYPVIWKTVGDEVIFCSRVLSVDHTAVTVSAFVRALEQYALKLKQDGLPLGVKGACWLAAFPAPNATIEVVTQKQSREDDPTIDLTKSPEAIKEDRADSQPHLFDFLGKGIDTGFRIAKNAAEDRCVVSVQLAYLLAKAATKKRFHQPLGYHGREVLKGVVGGLPYPVISVDTERNELNWMLRSREAALRGERAIDEYALCDFLETFMQVANIELPCLPFRDDIIKPELPSSYRAYIEHFRKNDEIDEKNLSDVEQEDQLAPNEDKEATIEPARAFLDRIVPEVDPFDDLSLTGSQ